MCSLLIDNLDVRGRDELVACIYCLIKCPSSVLLVPCIVNHFH